MSISFKNTFFLFFGFTLIILFLPKPVSAIDLCWGRGGCPPDEKFCSSDGKKILGIEYFCVKFAFGIGGYCSSTGEHTLLDCTKYNEICVNRECVKPPPPRPCSDFNDKQDTCNSEVDATGNKRCTYCSADSKCYKAEEYSTKCGCSDGTPRGQCSSNAPKYCDNAGNLYADCEKCGYKCPKGCTANACLGGCRDSDGDNYNSPGICYDNADCKNGCPDRCFGADAVTEYYCDFLLDKCVSEFRGCPGGNVCAYAYGNQGYCTPSSSATPASCGNGICDSGENTLNCPLDCTTTTKTCFSEGGRCCPSCKAGTEKSTYNLDCSSGVCCGECFGTCYDDKGGSNSCPGDTKIIDMCGSTEMCQSVSAKQNRWYLLRGATGENVSITCIIKSCKFIYTLAKRSGTKLHSQASA